MNNLLKKIIRLYRRLKHTSFGWHGDYPSWEAAQQKSSGYDASNIVQKVRNAAIKVKKGEALYERDSILFDKIEYSWPLLSNLLWIANQQQGKLSVIDFGGSLGSTFFQNRLYLDTLKEVKWSIVEQKNFVTIGQSEIGDDNMQFFSSIDEALKLRGNHDVLLLSCVLPYLEKPYDFLKDIKSKRFKYIIIDNTYFNPLQKDRLTVQKVPPAFYDASYPAWFLDYRVVIATLEDKYILFEEYSNEHFLYLSGEKIIYRGFIMKSIS